MSRPVLRVAVGLSLVVACLTLSSALYAQDAGASSDSQPSEQTATDPEPDVEPSSSSPVEYCEQFVAAFARSSARKLYRALSGQGFDLKPIDLGDTIELEATTADGGRTNITFEVLTENDGLVAGIVDVERRYRRILIAANTTSGPVVASQLWPNPGSVPSETACRPNDSQIAVPPLTLGDIDIEPFKFWGLRIVWRLPTGYTADQRGPDALTKALTDALKQSIDDS